MDKATEQGTLLTDEMNHETLPVAHGAPLRLRFRTQLDYEMAKWVTRVEFVEDFDDLGKGQGGWCDDVLNYFASNADIRSARAGRTGPTTGTNRIRRSRYRRDAYSGSSSGSTIPEQSRGIPSQAARTAV